MMSPVPTIRDSARGEAPTLEALQRRAIAAWELHRAVLEAEPDLIAVPQQWIDDGHVRVAVDDDGRPVGFSVMLDGELDGIYVAPEAKGRGVGRLLFEDAVGRARAAGLGALHCTANPNSRGFYAAVGFVPIGEATSRFGQGVRMRLEL